MPLIGTTPFFHGKAVLVDLDPEVTGPRALRDAIADAVCHCESERASEDVLLRRINDVVIAREGLTARLVARTPEAIEVRVTTR